MERRGAIKIKSRLITAVMILALIAFLMGVMGVLKGGMVQDAEEVIGRGPEPGKIHVYPYFQLVTQVVFYTLIFFIPGFLVTSAAYPQSLLPERVVLSTALGALMYAFYVNLFLISGNLTFFVMSQIIWDLAYSIVVSAVGFVAWRIALSKLKTN